MTSRRPPFIGLLQLLVLVLTLSNTVRFYTSAAWGDTLKTYAPRPGPLYVGLTGAFWAVVGVIVFLGLYQSRPWAPRLFVGASVVYTGWYWLDRLFIQSGTRTNWAFSLLVMAVLWILSVTVLLNPHYRIYFEREAYERKPQNPPSE